MPPAGPEDPVELENWLLLTVVAKVDDADVDVEDSRFLVAVAGHLRLRYYSQHQKRWVEKPSKIKHVPLQPPPIQD